MNRVIPLAILGFGLMLDVGGLALAGIYIIEAVIRRFGEPDQSLLFWYLPLLMTGLICLLIGIAATYWGISQIRKLVDKPGENNREN